MKYSKDWSIYHIINIRKKSGVFATSLSTPIIVYVSNDKSKDELESEFKQEIMDKHLKVVVQKMSGMKKLHHLLSVGNTIGNDGTVGAIFKS
jgi:hypothetical protein